MNAFSSPDLEVDPERVAQWLDTKADVQVIDVRETYEREAGHIEASLHIELERLASKADSIDRQRPVVFYCRIGARSAMAAQAFQGAGYEAYSMRGGLTLWAQEGRPLWPADGHVAEH